MPRSRSDVDGVPVPEGDDAPERGLRAAGREGVLIFFGTPPDLPVEPPGDESLLLASLTRGGVWARRDMRAQAPRVAASAERCERGANKNLIESKV